MVITQTWLCEYLQLMLSYPLKLNKIEINLMFNVYSYLNGLITLHFQFKSLFLVNYSFWSYLPPTILTYLDT